MLRKAERRPVRRASRASSSIYPCASNLRSPASFSSPERRNAITRAMWRALPAIRTAIEAREDVLVALVQGEGAHFSAGADISEFDEVYRDAAATRDYGDTVQDGLRALKSDRRPSP